MRNVWDTLPADDTPSTQSVTTAAELAGSG